MLSMLQLIDIWAEHYIVTFEASCRLECRLLSVTVRPKSRGERVVSENVFVTQFKNGAGISCCIFLTNWSAYCIFTSV